MKQKFIYSLLATALLLSACSTDLDVVGDYKETMVVYGILDQSKTTQYIKINKAFLGPGNAMEYAKVKDSVQFVNALNVVLKRIKNGAQVGADIALVPDNSIPKSSGMFYSADQANAIYSTSAPVYSDSEYQLYIVNNETGTKVSSSTILVSDFSFIKPIANTNPYGFVSPTNPNLTFGVEWNAAKNARVYQLTVRLNYTDYLDNNGDNVIDDSVSQVLDWVFPTQKTDKLDGTGTVNNDFTGKDFLRFIGSRLDPYPTLFKRLAGNVDLIVVAAADDLNTFIEVNAPSTGIIQQKPEFTNISNGLGVFSSRYYKPLLPLQTSKKMSGTSLDTLACGQFTKDLKFLNALKQVDAQGKPIVCP